MTHMSTLSSYAVRLCDWVRDFVSPKTTLGAYEVGEQIGQGGMGEVYRGRHERTGRDVAIKILPLDRADAEGRARFEREAELTSRLASANTVTVHGTGVTPDGRPYYVMELVEGYDLDRLVTTYGAQPAGRVVSILRQICNALEEAHAAGVIHRDIKPANIALCERAGAGDVVKVLDFGLAEETSKLGHGEGRALVGTPAYLAPEAIRSPDALDGRIDLYALGAVGYWLLTGEPVFDGNSIVEICSHHLHTAPKRPSTRVGHAIPTDLEDLVLACLSKDPAQRPASARALAEALEACACAAEWSASSSEAWWHEERGSLAPCDADGMFVPSAQAA